MNVLDLFSGIGGFSLGFERAGFRTVAFCEIEPYCRAVLAKRWPGVPIYPDVRELTAERLRADGIAVDAICGGFPCQDISLAGRGAGLDGAKSGLWSEYRRLVSEIRPRFVVIENSPALRTRGADRILAELEALDYTCEPIVVGAMHAGAWHRRLRAWLVAYLNGEQHQVGPLTHERSASAELPADADGPILWDKQGRRGGSHRSGEAIPGDHGPTGDAANTDGARLEVVLDGDAGQLAPAIRTHAWSFEPDVVRVVYGVPARAHRIRSLGNSVVPQITEAIGRSIVKTWPEHFPHERGPAA